MNINQYPSEETTSSLPSLIGIKELFRSSINLFVRNIRLFTGIAGIFMLLSIAMGYALVFFDHFVGRIKTYYNLYTGFSSLLVFHTTPFLILFVGMVAYAWFSGSVITVLMEITSGRPIIIKQTIKNVWLIKWSFLPVTIPFTLVFWGIVLLLSPAPDGCPEGLAGQALVLLFILFLLVSFISFVWLFLCPYVLIFTVCENLKGWAAFSRSRELLRGYWRGSAKRVLFLCGTIGSIILIIYFLALIIEQWAFSMLGGIVVGMLFWAIIFPFGIIYLFVLYKNLKSVKKPLPL